MEENKNILKNMIWKNFVDYSNKKNKKLNMFLIEQILNEYHVEINTNDFYKLKQIVNDFDKEIFRNDFDNIIDFLIKNY